MKHWPWCSAGGAGSLWACGFASECALCARPPQTTPPLVSQARWAESASPCVAAAAPACWSLNCGCSHDQSPLPTAHSWALAPGALSDRRSSPVSPGDLWPLAGCGSPAALDLTGSPPPCLHEQAMMPDGGADCLRWGECSLALCSGCPCNRTEEPGRCGLRRSGKIEWGTRVQVSPHSFKREKGKVLLRPQDQAIPNIIVSPVQLNIRITWYKISIRAIWQKQRFYLSDTQCPAISGGICTLICSLSWRCLSM